MLTDLSYFSLTSLEVLWLRDEWRMRMGPVVWEGGTGYLCGLQILHSEPFSTYTVSFSCIPFTISVLKVPPPDLFHYSPQVPPLAFLPLGVPSFLSSH